MVPRQENHFSMNMSNGRYNVLTTDEVEHFIKHGWLKIPHCFTRKQADGVCANVWDRLRMDPKDKSTWHTEWQALRGDRDFKVNEFAPRAWAAICDLVREERIPEWNDSWSDDLIVNLGSPAGAGKDIGPREIYSWHVDGDFFVHFLDSPEQALLVVPLWTDIPKSCGGTMICPDSIPIIALHMYDHSEGVKPDMIPRGDKSRTYENFYNQIAQMMPDESFVEITGEVGDVYIMHPFMLHSTSNNKLRRPRIISNPNVQLKEPFNFARPDPSQYSVVELCTKQALGNESLKTWRIMGAREFITPERDQQEETSKQSLDAMPRLRSQSGSDDSGSSDDRSRDSSGDNQRGDDSRSESRSGRSSASASKEDAREHRGEAGASFLKGLLNPRRHILRRKSNRA